MDKPELKPCPFCGGEPEITEVIDRTPRNLEAVGFGVKCDQCGIIVAKIDCGVTDWFETDEEAAKAWNRRVDSKISVGDKVYQTNGFNTYESTVKRVLYDTEKITFDADAIGQSVFLTREEAEKRTMHLALEEAENHEAENHDEKS